MKASYSIRFCPVNPTMISTENWCRWFGSNELFPAKGNSIFSRARQSNHIEAKALFFPCQCVQSAEMSPDFVLGVYQNGRSTYTSTCRVTRPTQSQWCSSKGHTDE